MRVRLAFTAGILLFIIELTLFLITYLTESTNAEARQAGHSPRLTPTAGTPVQTATTTATTTATATATSTSTCVPRWSVAGSPNPPNTPASFLRSVKAISADDVWAVGTYTAAGTDHALIEHWNGLAWSIVQSPEVAGSNNALLSIGGSAASDLWAVGYSAGSTGGRSLALHWDGSAWTIVATPHVGVGTNALSAVSVRTANDAWAVGYQDAGVLQPLAIHWDGSAWNATTVPSVGAYDNALNGVASVAANDVWAVGYYTTPNAYDFQTLIEHWDGSTWSIVTSPNAAASDTLFAIAALSSTDIWAAGYTVGSNAAPMFMHWNGTSWQVVPGPSLGTGAGGGIFGLTAVATNDVWATGYYYPGSISHTLSLHWDGTSWSLVSSPNSGSAPNYLTGISAAPNGELWAVGYSGTGGTTGTLIERYSTQGCVAPCAISFNDVHTTDWFYGYVQCLFCRGAITGYADNTFRPYNSTTRGQLSKIVAIGMALQSATPSGTPTFRDVPPGSAFYTYVETAAANALVSGYACGGPTEPCPGLYFRPNANITRGQLAKIAVQAGVIAYGWQLRNPATPSFGDVPADNPFYTYIETAACRGIISGYLCGGPGEPCPASYFRPYANATRAQISKIVCILAQNPPSCTPQAKP